MTHSQAELAALNERLTQENQRITQELNLLKGVTHCRFPVEVPGNPNLLHVIRGTTEGILALQQVIKERFADGRALGFVEAQEVAVG